MAKPYWRELGRALRNGLEHGCKSNTFEPLCESTWLQIWVALIISSSEGLLRSNLLGPLASRGDICWEEVGVAIFLTSLFGVNFGSI